MGTGTWRRLKPQWEVAVGLPKQLARVYEGCPLSPFEHTAVTGFSGSGAGRGTPPLAN